MDFFLSSFYDIAALNKTMQQPGVGIRRELFLDALLDVCKLTVIDRVACRTDHYWICG